MRKGYWLYKVLSLILALIMMLIVPVAAMAESNTNGIEDIQNNSMVEDENADSSEIGNYSYSAPDAGRFVIKNVKGVISIVNNIPMTEQKEIPRSIYLQARVL